MHPHRGIETVTYMLAGVVRHRDSVDNSGATGTAVRNLWVSSPGFSVQSNDNVTKGGYSVKRKCHREVLSFL